MMVEMGIPLVLYMSFYGKEYIAVIDSLIGGLKKWFKGKNI